MKECPTCGSKYPDDFDICNACEVQLIDHKIAKEIHDYGVDNKKLQKKYPEECRIVLESRIKIKERRRNSYKPSSVTISQSAMPNKSKIEPIQTKDIPKCPTCGSINIKRITTLDRAISIGFLGLLSGDIGKNYECLNCKAKW